MVVLPHRVSILVFTLPRVPKNWGALQSFSCLVGEVRIYTSSWSPVLSQSKHREAEEFNSMGESRLINKSKNPGLWGKMPGENPHMYREHMQTAHRKDHAYNLF